MTPDRRSCQTVAADPDSPEEVEVNSSLLYLRSARTVPIYLGRFGSGLDTPAWAVPAGTPIGYLFPADRSDVPWRIGFKGEGEVTVCDATLAG